MNFLKKIGDEYFRGDRRDQQAHHRVQRAQRRAQCVGAGGQQASARGVVEAGDECGKGQPRADADQVPEQLRRQAGGGNRQY
ncbi:hypothetical protein D9M71_705640 [compost metagenome]